MGRLLNPGFGELADRLTILVLKVERAPAGRDTTHFREEHAQVQHRLDHIMSGTELMDAPDVTHAVSELLKANTTLWALEDEMATFAGQAVADEHKMTITIPTPVRVAELGVTIWQVNRYRNELIATLNRLAGTERGPEKLP